MHIGVGINVDNVSATTGIPGVAQMSIWLKDGSQEKLMEELKKHGIPFVKGCHLSNSVYPLQEDLKDVGFANVPVCFSNTPQYRLNEIFKAAKALSTTIEDFAQKWHSLGQEKSFWRMVRIGVELARTEESELKPASTC